MCAQIVDLNELVPEDIIVRYGKPAKDYRLPGDIPTKTVFGLFKMFQEISAGVTDGDAATVVSTLDERFAQIEGAVLALFQQRDPKLKELPWGIRGTGEVLKVILGELGLKVTAANPTPPTPKRTAKRATSVRARPRR